MAFTRMLRGPQLLGERLGHGVDGRLGRAVDDAVGRRDGARDRADVDDTAARREMLDRLLRRENEPEHIQVEVLVKVLLGDVLERHELVDPGIVDEDVDAAERLLRRGEEMLDVPPASRRWRGRRCLPALVRDLSHDSIRAFLAGEIVDDDRGPLRRHMCRDGSADSLGSAVTIATFPSSLPMLKPLSLLSSHLLPFRCRPVRFGCLTQECAGARSKLGVCRDKPARASRRVQPRGRRPKAAREAYFLYVDRADEGANEADEPFSAL
jgi:hypothetical protein